MMARKLSMFGNQQQSSVLLLALTLCAAAFAGRVAAECCAGDKQALLRFKSQLNYSTDPLASWNTSSNCCTWVGILCDAAGQRVAGVSLTGLQVKRSIKGAGASLGALQALTNLDLGNVDFGYAHRIPTQLGNLKSLGGLTLYQCHFMGDIPPSLGSLTKLTFMSMSGNRFTGGIPSTFGNLQALTTLVLSDNGLKTIGSKRITKLKKLQTLFLNDNELSGRIPTWIGGLTVRTLDLSGNPLSGPIPGALCNIRGLTRLYLTKTLLSAIPAEIGNCKTLEELDLSDSKLRGRLPATLGKLNNLESINVGSNSQTGNRLTCTLPASIGDLPKLSWFNIANNQISGRIPPTYGEPASLTSFSGNKLTGPIPTALSTLPADACIPTRQRRTLRWAKSFPFWWKEYHFQWFLPP